MGVIRVQGRCELLGEFAFLIDAYDAEDDDEQDPVEDGNTADAIGFEIDPCQIELDFDGEPLDE